MESKQRQRMFITIGVMAAIVLVAAAVMIALSSNNATQASGIDYSKIPQSRTADGAFVLGSPDAKVTIVEFADFRCPHCQDYKSTMDSFVKDFVVTGKAKYEYRMFPTVDGPTNGYVSRLAECVDILKPSQFWVGEDTLYTMLASNGFDPTGTPRAFAEKMGVDYAQLVQCTQSAKQVDTDLLFGESLNVQGTPTVMARINGQAPTLVGGTTQPSYSQLQNLVSANS
jgi:protein-disulfide isomerase